MKVLSRPQNISSIIVRKSAESTRASAVRRVRGFTLVELMITLVVAVILIIVAVPSFTNMILSNKLTTTANDIVGAINSARMEAIKRNADTQVCSDLATNNTSDTLGSKCGIQTGAVVVLTGSGTTATASVLLAVPPGLVAPIQLHGDMTAVRFTGQGLGQNPSVTSVPYNGLIVDICTSQISTNNHRQINMATGTILSITSASGACP
jgi:type IV fimbrial biogenesis protein FimT